MGKECGAWVSRRLWGGGNTSPLKTTAWEATHSACIILFGRSLISRLQGKPQMVIFGELAFGYFCEHHSTVLQKKRRLVYLPITPDIRKNPLKRS